MLWSSTITVNGVLQYLANIHVKNGSQFQLFTDWKVEQSGSHSTKKN